MSSSDYINRLKYCNPQPPCCVNVFPTVNVDICGTQFDISHADVYADSAIVDICSGTVAISNVTLSGDLGILANGDAFGRLRVSNPYTLFEFSSILGKQPDIIDEAVSGSGSTTAMIGDSYIALDVSGVGYAIRQSHEYIPYQPGKSKLVYMTGVLQDPNGADMSGNVARIGCFDASMGFYIESSGGMVSVVKHNSIFEAIPRSAWVDRLDGSGASGVTVDFRKAQIFVFDFEWLGVGQVRCGVVIGGQLIYYYIFTHVNSLTMPYIAMAKLPLRYEIRGSIGAAQNQMRMICGTVISEGGFIPLTRTLTYGRYTSAITTVTTKTALKGLVAIRIRSDYPFNRASIKLKSIDIFNTGGGTTAGAWVALLNPTFSVTPTFTDYDSVTSAAQICDLSGNITITGENIIYSGFYATRDYNQLNSSIEDLIAARPITYGLTGIQDTVVIAANSLGSSSPTELYYFLKWIEYI